MGYCVKAHDRHLLVASLCPGLLDPDPVSVATGMEGYAIQKSVA